MRELIYFIGYLGIGSSCLPISAYFLKLLKNEGSKISNIVNLLAIYYFIFNLLIFILFLNSYFFQNFIVNLYYILEFLILAIFFYRIYYRNYYSKNFVFILSGIIPVIIFSCIHYDLNENYLLLVILQKTVLIYLSFLYFYKTYQNHKSLNLSDSPYFWINIGILLYNSATIFVSLFENYLRQESIELYFLLWPINQISGIIYYSFFSFGIWKLKN